ncbi:MAG: hypothetical protein Tsb0015_11730 [Simkaniaceae bacterium]
MDLNRIANNPCIAVRLSYSLQQIKDISSLTAFFHDLEKMRLDEAAECCQWTFAQLRSLAKEEIYTQTVSKVGSLTRMRSEVEPAFAAPKQQGLNKLSDEGGFKFRSCRRHQKPTFETVCVYMLEKCKNLSNPIKSLITK